ncbi:MerR family transcriptional regulator [Mastigocoleus testarum]|uniref:MerR family transcriptional regulator n=1 Tax=Mastigocoleus testarum BC008 TaxID=371196 RepID=A0A0V7ZWT9_9CYAN|nr:MerR family transcriptional regulator [Mastigocoleus testarum]KST63073.1 MerR family transcriptional regulator [Mastigocoleus testarum BC008]KST69068.1 MerR family transcriptional regulator [Mastigocoleus testarum BC008]
MEDTFFTSKQAAQITGCTLRQLQYWREKNVVVPVISETGTGRSIYYSISNLVELSAMSYWLGAGLNFDIASDTLRALKEKEPELFKSGKGSRWMLHWNVQKEKLCFEKFDREKAIASLDKGQIVIPVWLDLVYQGLKQKLGN